jgi:hypothetical protein
MNKRRNFAWRELILLFVPILALGGWALWLQSRGPFKLVLDEINIKPQGTILPADLNLREVQVSVFIGHKGSTPPWWGVAANLDNPRVHFTRKGEKDDGSNVGDYAGVHFDKLRAQYTFVYTGNIPKDPNYLKEATCHISVGLETQRMPSKKLATAKTSIPVHQLQ